MPLRAYPATPGPFIVTPAAATPNPVTSTTVGLSVLGGDSAGESVVTYTWATTGTPPAAVTFSANGTNAAKNSTATFSKAGAYTFLVTLDDSSGITATSNATVTVNQTATSVSVSTGGNAIVAAGAVAQLTATTVDQFGTALAAQPAVTWSVSGVGTVGTTGVYTAPATAGTATVSAVVGGLPTATTGLTVVATAVWYKMNSPGGNSLTDSSGNNKTASLTGNTGFTTGVSGNAVSLSGGSASLPTGVVSALNDFTISAWVKPTALANWARVFDFGTGTTNYMFLTTQASGAAVRFGILNSSVSGEQQLNGGPITAGAWSHLAVTVSGTTGTLYINGAVAATNSAMTLHPSSLGSTTQNYLGRSQFSSDPLLAGLIDDFRIYAAALPAAQVAQLALPAVTAPAAPAANPVTTTGTTLSVSATDETAGSTALTYTWATTGTPPAAVTFSANGTNAAKTTTAAFTKAGTYSFAVTITNPAAGLTSTSSVTVVVNQTLTTISVTPTGLALGLNATQQFTAAGADQFGAAMAVPPAYTFSLGSGSVGSITAAGVYTAPATGNGGTANIVATSGTVTGSTSVTVTTVAPSVVDTAAVSVNPVVGTTANLSVLGGDSGGESTLKYTWSTTGTPPAVVGFSVNGSNAAKNTAVTFAKAGIYTLQATITNGSNFSTYSAVTVTVNQTSTIVSVTAASATVAAGAGTQLTATALDQFGLAMAAQPSFSWSVPAGAGTVSSSGFFTAAAAAGSVSVSAAVSGGPTGSVNLTVVTPRAWYQMDASSGTTLTDSSGNGQTGTLIGSTGFTAGVTGNALTLTGGNANLPAGIVSGLTSFTISAWVKVTTLATWSRVFDFGTGTTNFMFLTPVAGTTNAIRFSINSSGGGEQQLNGPAMSVNAWTHLAVTFSGTTGTLFVNGVSVATNSAMTFTPAGLGTTTQNYLGKSQFSPDPAFTGSIDDFRIYNTALPAQQVQQIAGLTLPAGWTDSDVGSPTRSGGAFYIPSSGVWTVNGGGTDIGGTADQLNFVSTNVTGDAVLVAEVTSVGASDPAAKAGLMIRSSTAAGSVEASILMTPSNGVYFETRSAAGATTASTQWSNLYGPVWLKLERYGSNVTGSLSNDKIHWYRVGSTTAVPLGGAALAGLAVSAHATGGVSASTFTNVSVSANAAPTIVTAAAAGATNFTGYSTSLSAFGSDDAGESGLTYTWSTAGTPAAAVSFSVNGSNAAKRTAATFTASGTYNLVVTITDPGGLSTTSGVTVVVSVPPLPPVGVSSVWTGSTVTVAWQAAVGATSYRVYRSSTVGGEGSTPIASNVSGSNYADPNVTAGTTYYYQVTAVGPGGESGRSFETAALPSPYAGAIVSEFMAINATTIHDSAGDYDDWIELYNPTAAAVTLTGDYLTDDSKTLNLWQLPALTLAPGASTIIWADSTNAVDGAGAPHTNFNLGGTSGYLALVSSNGLTVLSSYTYGQQAADVSYGVGISTTGGIAYGGAAFLAPTPAALNGPVIATGIAATPTFNVPAGFYSSTFQLMISTTTAGAVIYCTTDGTAPSATNGTPYTGPLTITGESNVRATAIAPGLLPSAAAAVSYIYLNQVIAQSADGQAPAGWPVDWGYSITHYGMDPAVVNSANYSSEIVSDLLSLPSVSLTLNLNDLFDPVSGIYSESQSTQDGESAASIELLNPSGAAGFQANVGLTLKGDYSAISRNAKHGFNVHFSSKYGASSLKYPIFGPNAAQSFEEIQLRTDQNNSWSYDSPSTYIAVRDQISSSLLAAAGQTAEHYQVCFLYINGQFWGLYDMIEHPDADFAASYFGGDASRYDSLKATNLTATAGGTFGVLPVDGTLTAWNQLFANVSTLDLSSDANFQLIQGNNPDGTKNASYANLIDVNNLIDYMLVIYYTGNYDAPYSTFIHGPNNFYAIRPIDGSFGFRFVATDSEWSLLNVNQNSVNLAPTNITLAQSAGPAYFFQKLEANANFRVMVGDHVQRLFFNGGPMSVSSVTSLFNTVTAQVRGAVVGESARWGNVNRPGQSYTRDTDWTPLLNTMLASYFPQRTGIVVGQLQAVGLYPVTPPPPTFNQYGGSIPSGFQLSMSQTGSGTIYYTLNGADPRNADGSVSPTAVVYSSAITLTATTEVKARIYSGGSWSALVDSTFVTAASSVRITELNYDPNKPTGSSYNNDDFEYVELENFSSQTVNLAGVAFTDGITYTFGATTLGPWQVGVLVKNLTAFQSRYGASVYVLGSYESTGQSFSNSGEQVTLVDATGNVLNQFNYTSTVVPLSAAHGNGRSLEVIDPTGSADLNLSSGWTVGPTNGTPGTIPLRLGNSSAYVMLNADGQRADVWYTATATGSPAMSIPTAEIYALTFTAANGSTGLTIDDSKGNPLPSATLTFNGGSAAAPLTVVGSTGADSLAINASTAVLSGTFGSTSISYTNASAVNFVGNGGADVLTQTARPANGAGVTFADTPGGTTSTADTLNVNGGTFAFPAPAAGAGAVPIRLAMLSIGPTASVTVGTAASSSDRSVLVLGSLSLAPTGLLDVGGNDLMLHNASLSTIQIAMSNAVGGPGIVSSAAASNAARTTTLAAVQSSGVGSFDGQSTAPTDVLVKYTYLGDANFDGKVDGSDYTLIDAGYLAQSTAGWLAGDFNGDGIIDGSDYSLIDNAFNRQATRIAPSALAAAVPATSEAKPAAAKSLHPTVHAVVVDDPFFTEQGKRKRAVSRWFTPNA